MNPGNKECKRTCSSWEGVTFAYWSKFDRPFFTIVELKCCPNLVLWLVGFEDGVYSLWYDSSLCTILWWWIVPMSLSIHRGWLCGGLIYSCNFTLNTWKSELNLLHSANFHRFKSAGVGCWVGNYERQNVLVGQLAFPPSLFYNHTEQYQTCGSLFHACAWCSKRSDQVD